MSADSTPHSSALDALDRLYVNVRAEYPFSVRDLELVKGALVSLEEQLEVEHGAAKIALAEAARQINELKEQLESVRRAAEWEQEHGGCFCRACNEAIGASSPASRQDT